MMRLIVDVVTLFITVVILNTGSVYTKHKTEDCNLQPSELGPDWYKVSRPVPPGFDGKPAYEASSIHMPCAKSTVFDIGVCGCTSLMSFIFTSVSVHFPATSVTLNDTWRSVSDLQQIDRFQQHSATVMLWPSYTQDRQTHIHHDVSDVKLDPDDFVKQLDESTTPRPLPGSILINTRTGEVKECPFRASNRGPRWYLIREPRDKWRHMVCAPGTLFEKRSCTCVHQLKESREPDKPGDSDIVIIEENWGQTDKTISQSLGISVSDVDFSTSQRHDDIPFWRRNDFKNSRLEDKKDEKRKLKGSPDIKVTLHSHVTETDIVNKQKEETSLNIGGDAISKEHKDLFFKSTGQPIAQSKAKKISALVLDSNINNRFDTNNNLHSDIGDRDLLMNAKQFGPRKRKVDKDKAVKTDDILNVLDEISTQINVLESQSTHKEHIATTNTQLKSGTDTIGFYEEILHKRECLKKPLPELGPQYFLLHVVDAGDVPFTCHGNSVYNDTLCACIPVKDDTAYDEVLFPKKDCTRRPLPDLGPEYFLDHLHNVGYIPFICHDNKLYDANRCECV